MKKDGLWNRRVLIICFVRSLTSFVNFLASFFMIFYSVSSGINASVIVTIVSCSIFTTAITFKLVFNQALTVSHYIGMTMLFLCVVITSL